MPLDLAPHELTPRELRFTPPELDEASVAGFVERHWGLRGKLRRLAGERDQNFRVATDDGDRFVLKIGSPKEDVSLVDYQVRALLHIESRDPSIPVPRLVRSNAGNPAEQMIASDDELYPVRLLTWVPGVPMREFVPPPVAACHAIGNLQGRLCGALEDFEHAAKDHFMPWDALNGLMESPALRTGYLPGDLQDTCTRQIERLANDSLPRMRELPAQVIHNDAHTGNVMCDPGNPAEVTGVIDFGDLAHRPIIIDLATSLTSFMGHAADPLEAARVLVKGFNDAFRISAEQFELLFDAILTRAILTVQLLTFRARHTDAGESLLTIDVPDAIDTLRVLLDVDPDTFLATVTP